MKIGYVRVSTPEQNTARQEEAMQVLGVEKLFVDYASGKNTSRKELTRMLEFVREGDVVIVEAISRFARNAKDLLGLIEHLSSKKAGFVSQKEAIDTGTATGKFMLTVFAAVSELERDSIRERQREGIRIAKGQGLYKGRRPKEYPGFDDLYGKCRKGEITAASAMRQLGMSKTTWYRRMRGMES